jgi:hypothetical protein
MTRRMTRNAGTAAVSDGSPMRHSTVEAPIASDAFVAEDLVRQLGRGLGIGFVPWSPALRSPTPARRSPPESF